MSYAAWASMAGTIEPVWTTIQPRTMPRKVRMSMPERSRCAAAKRMPVSTIAGQTASFRRNPARIGPRKSVSSHKPASMPTISGMRIG